MSCFSSALAATESAIIQEVGIYMWRINNKVSFSSRDMNQQ